MLDHGIHLGEVCDVNGAQWPEVDHLKLVIASEAKVFDIAHDALAEHDADAAVGDGDDVGVMLIGGDLVDEV